MPLVMASNEDGALDGLYCFMQDISARKQAEEVRLIVVHVYGETGIGADGTMEPGDEGGTGRARSKPEIVEQAGVRAARRWTVQDHCCLGAKCRVLRPLPAVFAGKAR